MNLPALLALGASPLLAAVPPPQDIKDLVEVQLQGQTEARLLFELATDPDDHFGITSDGRARIYADDAEQERLRNLGFSLTVLQENLSTFYADRAAADPMLDMVGGSMGGFKTLAEIEAEMDRLAAAHPNLVSSKFSIGRSVQGRDIWAMRVSDNPNVNEPAEPTAWYDAIHHAREPMSGESLLLFADWLVSNYGSDPEVTRVVDSRNILFVPCVNPDGYEYNRQTNPNGGGLWRKNRRNNGGSFGVDLNRNYDWEWGPQHPGSSGNPNSETYRGPSAFSEPETRAVRNAVAVSPPGQAITAHTYSNLWIFPYGYTNNVFAPDDAVMRAYSREMTRNNGWAFGTGWETLYPANGVTDDWMYGAHGTFAYTPEIGGNGDGFWPAPSRIVPLFEAVRPGYLMVAKWSGGFAEPEGFVQSEVSGNGDNVIDPGETWDFELDYLNAGILAVNLQLSLSSSFSEITVDVANASASLPVRQTGRASALRVSFGPTAQSGVVYDLDLAVSYEGVTSNEKLNLLLGRARRLMHDDMELQDFGWTVNNSTNWSWERGVPQQTVSSGSTVQPGQDNPQGSGTRCWVTGAAAGASAGTNDVDGVTRLISPIFSLEGWQAVELEYARWFANIGNNQDDVLLVEASDNGGQTWTVLETTGNDNQWRTQSFQLESFVNLTDTMRLRFTAADQPNNDLTEACLDDVILRTFSGLPTVGTWGELVPGSALRLFLDGDAMVSYALEYSFQRNNGVTVPGIEGKSFLAGSIKRFQAGMTDGQGLAEVQVNIPNKGSLSGRTVYLQGLFDENGPAAAYSNLVTLRIQ